MKTDSIRANSVPLQREQFGSMLGRLARAWRAEIDARLTPFGLTQSRWMVLYNLSKGAGGLSQRALAAQIGVQGPTLVRTLDLLEAEGLIKRTDSPDDRRVKTIHVTPNAVPELKRIQSAVESVRAEIFAGISDAQIAVCIKTFTRIKANLLTHAGQQRQSTLPKSS